MVSLFLQFFSTENKIEDAKNNQWLLTAALACEPFIIGKQMYILKLCLQAINNTVENCKNKFTKS